MSRPRLASANWNQVMVPEVQFLPPVAEIRKERVLHVALRDVREKQPGLEKALREISSMYAEVDWVDEEQRGGRYRVVERMLGLSVFRPTLVFMQLQRKILEPPDIIALRALCDPNVVIVNLDGDQHFEPDSPERAWFVELGAVCDASLVVNTKHPAEYLRLGVKNPGYLQIGTDDRWRAVPKAEQLPAPPIVWLCNAYTGNPAYAHRRKLVEHLDRTYGPKVFGVYGSGWEGLRCGHQFVSQTDESRIYSAAKAAISSSIRSDLPRYTSDRLFRILKSQCIALVEEFPDMRGLGLHHGETCLEWSTVEELDELINEILMRLLLDDNMIDGLRWEIGNNAGQLAREYHIWDARMPELAAIMETVRSKRR